MNKLSEKINVNFKTIDYVATCMGTVVLGLYLEKEENRAKANSLTLFSPLYTFDYSFLNPPITSNFLYNKKQIIENGNQFHLGNAVEEKSTYEEIKRFSKNFLENIKNLNVETLCLQGKNDALVPSSEQFKLFTEIINNRNEKELKDVYYAEIPAVHCLYDSIYPSLIETSDFINSNHPKQKKLILK